MKRLILSFVATSVCFGYATAGALAQDTDSKSECVLNRIKTYVNVTCPSTSKGSSDCIANGVTSALNEACSIDGDSRALVRAGQTAITTITSSELAANAIARQGCRTAADYKQLGSVKTDAAAIKKCQKCYKKAKSPLKSRYDIDLFHGLLGSASRNIDERSITDCAITPPAQ